MNTLARFLSLAFDPGEHVYVATGKECNEERRSLSLSDAADLEGVSRPFGYFVGVNPCHPTGRYRKEDVAAIRSIVFESDTMPLMDQAKAIKDLGVPFSAAIFSGGKSIHFWIILSECLTEYEFDCFGERLRQFLAQNGFALDKSIKNVNRVMRLPTAFREEKGKRQEILSLRDRIDNSQFIFGFINAKCPPLGQSASNPAPQARGTITKAATLKTGDEAEAHCREKFPLLAGQKQGHLLAWAKYLVGNTALNRSEMVDLIARNDEGRNRNLSEYERAVDRAISMV